MSYLVGFFLPIVGIILLIFLLTLIQSSVDNGISKEARQSDEEHAGSDDNQEDIEHTHINPVADAIRAYHRRRDSHERYRAKREQINIVVLGLTAAFALVAAGAAIYSSWIFSGQLHEMHQASIDTALLARTARDTEERQLRAYLDISSTAPPELVPGQPAKVRFIILNSGHTPAYNVTPAGIGEIRSYPPPRLEVYPIPIPDTLVETAINPERTYHIDARTKVSLSKEQIDEVIDGSRFRLYFWGTVYYIDAFGIERHSNFCEIMGGREMKKSDVSCAHRGAD